MFEEIGNLIEKKEKPGNLDKAIGLLEELKRKHPENDVVRGKLSHAFFYKGFFEEQKKERERLFHKGMQCGNEAVTLYPEAVYGNFWYASNMGMWGMCRGIMASLKSVDPMFKAMQIVLKRNEAFFFGGPHRAIGRLYHHAPGWPLSIGNKRKALEHLERAVEIAPDFLCNRLWLAELLIDVGKKREARKQLDSVVSTRLNPDHAKEDGGYQEEAAGYLRKLF